MSLTPVSKRDATTSKPADRSAWEHHSCHRTWRGALLAAGCQLPAVRVVSAEVGVLAGWVQPLRAGALTPLHRREPIFNVPGVVLCLLGIFFAVHLLRWALPPEQSAWLTAALAFIPGRLGGFAAELPGGQVAVATAFVTHLFVHGDLTHLVINSAWLLAFGSPVARRTSTVRFLAFFALTGIAGALLYLAVNGAVLILLVGASGAISGLMGAAFRFLFTGIANATGGPVDMQAAPLTSLSATLRDRRVMTAVAGWTLLNVLLASGAAGLTEAAGIAWEAHLGGFFAGLLLYGFFEPPRSIDDEEHNDAAPAV